MNTTEFLTRLRQMNVELSVEDNRLKAVAPVDVITEELQQQIGTHKAELIRELKFEQASDLVEAAVALGGVVKPR